MLLKVSIIKIQLSGFLSLVMFHSTNVVPFLGFWISVGFKLYTEEILKYGQ